MIGDEHPAVTELQTSFCGIAIIFQIRESIFISAHCCCYDYYYLTDGINLKFDNNCQLKN